VLYVLAAAVTLAVLVWFVAKRKSRRAYDTVSQALLMRLRAAGN